MDIWEKNPDIKKWIRDKKFYNAIKKVFNIL